MLRASLLVIGDEILSGFVRDTNSGWLAERLRAHGVPLSRIHTLPDDLDAVDEALSAELGRPRPRLVMTSGGLGSTPDDVTFEAVAASLGRRLVEHPELAERIAGALAWTRETGVEVTDALADHMMRMARIPAGGTLLRGARGFVPGVRVDVAGGIDAAGSGASGSGASGSGASGSTDHGSGGSGSGAQAGEGVGGATVVILPGVPTQLRAIVREGVEPSLLAGRNRPPTVVELTHPFPESVLNVCFAGIAEDYPQVQLGSYPGTPMTVRLSGPEEPTRAAAAEVRSCIRRLEEDPAGARLAEAWAAKLTGSESQ